MNLSQPIFKIIIFLLVLPIAGCLVGADTDGDGVPDINDQCPLDPNKTIPGECACGVPEGTCSEDHSAFREHSIPGSIQIEDFDNGGEGVAYHDKNATNTGGEYRPSEGVDIGGNAKDGYYVGWIEEGEWLKYTIKSVESADYSVSLKVASNDSRTASVSVSLDGNHLGKIAVGNTGGWDIWETIRFGGATISGGSDKVLRIEINDGYLNLDSITFAEDNGNDDVADVDVEINWKSFLRRSDLVWTSLPSDWKTAPFIGNGLMGTQPMLRDRSSLDFAISRTDVFDHRNTGSNSVIHSHGRLPNGRFNLEFAGNNPSGAVRLDLWNAETKSDIRTSAGTIALRAFAHAIKNVIVLELLTTGGESGFRWTWHPQLSRSPRKDNPYNYYPPQTRETIDGVDVSIQSMPENAKYDTLGKGEGQYATAWKIVQLNNQTRYIYISQGYTYPGTGAKMEAVNAVNDAARVGIDSLESSHRSWWHTAYQKSFFSIPESKFESHYWIQIYKMLSAGGGNKGIIDLLGPWYTHTGWPMIWWNLNLQGTYSPFYAANHNDQANALIEHLYQYRANLAKVAGPYQADSYAIGRISSPTMVSEPKLELGNLAYALHNVWQQYRATMDDTMLRQKLFPLMKGAFNFLNHHLYTGNDGKLHMEESISPEYGGPGGDCNYTLSLLRWIAGAILYANDRLSLNDPVASSCQKVLNKLTPYPINSHGFMLDRERGFGGSHRHWSHLFMIYPLYEYTYDDPTQKDLVEKSLNRWLENDSNFSGYSYAAATSMFAMMEKSQQAYDYLERGIDRTALPNTLYAEGAPVMESPLLAARSMQDMVLQAYKGVIRIFGGVPQKWKNVSFHNFRADGGFLVSAKRVDGVTLFVRIESTAGEPCRVKTTLPGTVKAHGLRSFNLSSPKSGITQIDLRKGEWVILHSGVLPDLTISQVPIFDTANYWGTLNK